MNAGRYLMFFSQTKKKEENLFGYRQFFEMWKPLFGSDGINFNIQPKNIRQI